MSNQGLLEPKPLTARLFVKVKRAHNLMPEGTEVALSPRPCNQSRELSCYYVDRVLVKSGPDSFPRDTAWRHVPTHAGVGPFKDGPSSGD